MDHRAYGGRLADQSDETGIDGRLRSNRRSNVRAQRHADPYCPTLRPIAVQVLRSLGIDTHDRGTVVVVNGPRFSTRAESKSYQTQGWEVINMTQYPECYLARELEICYVNISLITDYDVGLEDSPPVSVTDVVEVFNKHNERIKEAIEKIVPMIPTDADCSCRRALETARF
jgi:5'-methylthioadenosine phosphorylase